MSLPSAYLTKDDKKANIIILSVSAVVFLAVIVLHELNLKIQVDFNPHIFAKFNAVINGTVSLLLILGLFFVKSKKYHLHKRVMNLSIILSVLFLLSYIAHHLLAESTVFGGEGSRTNKMEGYGSGKEASGDGTQAVRDERKTRWLFER